MEQDNMFRTLLYVAIIASFFVVLFVLDNALRVHYAPEEHRLNRPQTEPERSANVQSASLVIGNPETNKPSTMEKKDTAEANGGRTGVEREVNPEAGNDELFFEKLQEKYRLEILSKLPPRQSRTDVVIRYYRHPPDGQSAYALQKLGFYIHERPVDPGYVNFQSNAIFYGDSVRLEDIQLVAYTLLKEGLPLKTIAPSKFGNNWKSHSIEIGADTTLTSRKTVTFSEIRQLSL